MKIKPLSVRLDFRDPATWIATWGGCGLLRPAPGTWGTLGGLPFGVLMLAFGGWSFLLAASLVLLPLALWAVKRFEEKTETHDSSMIVVDEVIGIWLALAAASLTPLSVVLAFLLFRAFDVLKPGPIGWLDRRLPGAWGVMADDMLAGVVTAFCLWGLSYAGLN